MSMPLQTERLSFRRFQRSDAARLADLLNDLEIARWIGTMPHPYTRADADGYLDHVLHSGENTFVIEHKGALAGAISIGKMLGFWLARDHWGQGLMSEAARPMINAHFAQGAETLKSAYHLGNAASARVHQKLGFVEDGRSMVFAQALGQDVERQDLILHRATWEGRK